MSQEYSNISIKEIERENRLKRIKEAKDLDKKWSKKVVEANRENELQKKQKEEYIGAIELVRSINQQIAELQRDKDIYIKKQEESEIEKEKEKQMKYENMIREQEKKKQFDLFIKKKGIEASNYIRNEKEEEDRKYEELHRCEKKKQTKYEENIKTKKVIDNFLIKKEKEINEEKLNALNPNTMDVLYKITNPFHNHGNKIDYSTTRFHNVTIERHDNNLKDEINLKINAFERAKIEAENTKNKLNEKKNKLKEFKKNEKINYREQINKNRAKENLQKLNNEIQQFNKIKKENKNGIKKRIDINANINNAKQNEKKAEHMMNKLLENQKINRGKIYGENNEVTEKTPFIIGSVSKSFTALGVLKSGEDLNKTLDKFENLKDYIKDDVARDITVGELLNHTSGLESFGSHKIYEKGNYHYSNYGFSLLGKIIESKSGMSYNEFMTKNIFTPLGMNDTKAEYREDVIESYENFFGFRTKYGGLKSEIGDGFFIPAGFISTTVEDMGKYLRY